MYCNKASEIILNMVLKPKSRLIEKYSNTDVCYEAKHLSRNNISLSSAQSRLIRRLIGYHSPYQAPLVSGAR